MTDTNNNPYLSSLDLEGTHAATLHYENPELSSTTSIQARSFGAPVRASGEVVFNTGMVGYPEALTDPSYKGQILVLTYPLIGNYGVPSADVMDDDISPPLPLNMESAKIQISGLVVCSYTAKHSHWASDQSLGDWLASQGIPAVCGVDTRMVTKVIREHGSLLGVLDCTVDGGDKIPVR